MSYHKPNVKRWLVADPGYLFFEVDLQKADAQVVAWDSGDEKLKSIFKRIADTPPEQLSNHGPECLCFYCSVGQDVFGDRYTAKLYKRCKAGVHASNYQVKPATLAKTLGIKTVEASDFIRRYYATYPGIQAWHHRVANEVRGVRQTIYNAYGFRKVYQGNVTDATVREALAWIPQSTVAKTINKGMRRVHKEVTWVQILTQVHDSFAGQIPEDRLEDRHEIREASRIEIPYDEPLVIGRDIAVGPSWGELRDIGW